MFVRSKPGLFFVVHHEVVRVQRIFIVGCPRSGTTFVQAMLARHPHVLTLPESSFFESLYGNLAWRWGDRDARPRLRLRQRMGYAHQDARRMLARLQRQLLHRRLLSIQPLRTTRCAQRFVHLLDACAAAEGRSAWVEKTPCHLLYIPEIEMHVPDVQFIHVIRRGEDVLASIADASMRYVARGAFGGGMAKWSQRWNRAAEIHRACASRPNHCLVFLDDLVRDADSEWQRVCTFLGLDTAAALETSCVQSVADLRSEPWKRDAVSGLPGQPRHKAEGLFGPQARAWLHRQLLSYEDLHRSCTADAAVEERTRCGVSR